MRKEVLGSGVMEISTDFNEHPIFTPEENLRFRAVHDYLVHILPGERGPDFSRKGEIRAYNLHRRLAPRDTWPALFTEVLAQACYANSRGDFPTQKVAVFDDLDVYNLGFDIYGQKVGEAKAANPRRGRRSRRANPTEKDVLSLEEQIRDDHGLQGLILDHLEADAVRLTWIAVGEGQRGEGRGTRAMQDLTAWADRHGVILFTTPHEDNRAKLTHWYKSLGFESNKGRRKDFRSQELLLRLPQ